VGTLGAIALRSAPAGELAGAAATRFYSTFRGPEAEQELLGDTIGRQTGGFVAATLGEIWRHLWGWFVARVPGRSTR
jgi:hypothetical protein